MTWLEDSILRVAILILWLFIGSEETVCGRRACKCIFESPTVALVKTRDYSPIGCFIPASTQI